MTASPPIAAVEVLGWRKAGNDPSEHLLSLFFTLPSSFPVRQFRCRVSGFFNLHQNAAISPSLNLENFQESQRDQISLIGKGSVSGIVFRVLILRQ